ncbi:restriction endonuclease [Thermodesulfobacteriota bacterium]
MEKANEFKYYHFFVPIIEILKELGGSGSKEEITDLVIDRLNISEEEQAQRGGSYIPNIIGWSRNYLVFAELIEQSEKGVYSLTEKGLNIELSEDDAIALFKKIKAQMMTRRKPKTSKDDIEPASEEKTEDGFIDSDYREDLLDILKSLSPVGFERLCQRLLREAGFQQVEVTGKSSDGGIDGHGVLQVNPFVSFSVLFQCKRYQGVVSPSQIRDFRGAMTGRTDKGVFITTGSFTLAAKKEARREGVPPIEIVDGEKLIEMFELLELGLKPRKTYTIDREFFEEFK